METFGLILNRHDGKRHDRDVFRRSCFIEAQKAQRQQTRGKLIQIDDRASGLAYLVSPSFCRNDFAKSLPSIRLKGLRPFQPYKKHPRPIRCFLSFVEQLPPEPLHLLFSDHDRRKAEAGAIMTALKRSETGLIENLLRGTRLL